MNQTSIQHKPVLLDEVIENLQVETGKWYVDGTLGTGGHTRAILESGGKVVGFDQDMAAIESSRERLQPHISDLVLIHSSFVEMKNQLDELEIDRVAGILLDLGTSQLQLDMPGRGFSFQTDEPLDMRMNEKMQVTAKDLVNALGKKELTKLFQMYAQESHAKKISELIVDQRKVAAIETTGELAAICERAYGGYRGKIHPATKVFQALRMAVNDEVHALEAVLPQAEEILATGGRLLVISFHEGEDRIVKQFLQASNSLETITKKPITATASELANNHQARSAKLRVAEKK